jgi:hypothetical protein
LVTVDVFAGIPERRRSSATTLRLMASLEREESGKAKPPPW